MTLFLVLFVGRRPFLVAGGFAVSFFGRRGRLCTQKLIRRNVAAAYQEQIDNLFK